MNSVRLAMANYRLDRAFGWSRWRAVLRMFIPGKKLLYPPHIRREMDRAQICAKRER